jgi:hypothetical protein
MSDNQIGDGPIESTYEAIMQRLAGAVDFALNGETKGDDRNTGFVLLVFPFNDDSGRCNYISNGAARDDIVRLFQEQIKRFEGQT